MSREAVEDVAKGIGIILVVVGHAIRGLLEGNYGQSSDVWKAVDFVIYTTHMPLFFFLAGINSQSLLAGRGFGYSVSRMSAVLRPYIVWSLLLWAVRYVYQLRFHVNHPVGPYDLLVTLWNPKGVLWFLFALFWMQAAVVMLGRYFWMTLIAYILAETFFRGDVAGFAAALLVHLPFFVIGHYFGRRYVRLLDAGAARSACAVGLFALGAWYGFSRVPAHPVGIEMLPVSLIGIWMIMSLSSRLTQDAKPAFEFLGRKSLPIYLLHVITLAVAFRVLKLIGINDQTAMVVLASVVAVFLSLLLYWALDKIRLSTPLGLQPYNVTAIAR